MSATLPPRASFSSTPSKRWNPLSHKVGAVARAEELLRAEEELGIVLVPAEALADSEAFQRSGARSLNAELTM